MRRNAKKLMCCLSLILLSTQVFATDVIGQVKVLSGKAFVERESSPIKAKLGMPIYQMDTIVTGKKGSIGLLFNDDSRLSLGSNSTMSLENFNFNKKTHVGNFDVAMHKGTLSVISGKLTARKPGSLKVKTPAAILAVRGTEFSVKVEAPLKGKQ